MVLGFILYETVDLVYNVSKMTINGATFAYNWYYGINIQNLDCKIRTDEEHIKLLEDRVKLLENKLHIDDDIDIDSQDLGGDSI